MTGTAIPPETVFATHAGALRRLATQLLGDQHEVDDALQEVWMRTLESPPPTWERLRGWLETVLRNVVRRRVRQQRRRLAREAGSARGEQLASAADVAARRQTLRALTDAVSALPPAAQELVFLRYFEELPPREIARRIGRPVAAVYRGLDRARRQLRIELARRFGDDGRDWRGALAGLCGLPRGTTAAAASLTTGVLLMTGHKMLVAALAAGLLALLIFVPFAAGDRPDGKPSDDAAAALSAGDLGRGGTDGVAATTAAAARQEVETAGSSPQAALAPYEFELHVHAVDEDDLLAPDTQVWLGPEQHGLNSGQTGKDGVLRTTWRGRRPQMTMVYASPEGLMGSARLHRVSVRAGERAAVALRVKRRRTSTVRLTYGDVQQVSRGAANLPTGSFTVWARTSASGANVPAWQVDEDGHAVFVTRTGGLGFAVHAGLNQVLFDATELSLVRGGVFVPERRAGVPSTGRLSGRVLDQDGRPVRGALVVVGSQPGVRSTRIVRTGDDGSFEFVSLPTGTFGVRAGGGVHGLAQRRIDVGAGDDIRWDAHLDRGLELRGRLVDSDGQPLAGWRVEVVPEAVSSSPWIDGAETDGGGRFAIPNVVARAHRLRVWRPGAVLPSWGVASFWPAGEDLEIEVPDPATSAGTCVVHPGTEGVASHAAASGRLWRDDLGEGVAFDGGGPGGIRIEHLPPGGYRVVTGGPGFGLDHTSGLQILAGGAHDHIVVLPERAVLGLPEDARIDERTFELLRLHDAVCSRAGALGANARQLAVPPGEYVVTDDEGRRRVTVRPGANVLDIPEAR